jgi:hypothetical protein
MKAIGKTKFDSYSLNGIPRGCELCVVGRKMVLFITGVCSRNCSYCPLSEKRKNVDKIWANERECKNVSEVFDEIKKSEAQGMSITGGDPLIRLDRTLEYASAIKKKFGKKFHIHIYLSTKLVNEDNLRKLSSVIDEVRFHPDIDSNNINLEIEKIKFASKFWPVENIGVEIPLFPDKIDKEIEMLLKLESYISFVNLNELEIGESNLNYMAKKYKLQEGGYVVSGSLEGGLKIIEHFKNKKSKLKIHLCTANTKNWFQFKNRLKNYEVLPFGKKTSEGMVIYFVVEDAGQIEKIKNLKGIKFYNDVEKKRIIISNKDVRKLMNKFDVFRVEEFPTADRIEVERGRI